MKSVFTLKNVLTFGRCCKTLALTAVFLCVTGGTLKAQTVYALSGSNLITFNPSSPGTITSTLPLTGVASGQTVEGMDFRPATGQLFALGYNSSSGLAQLYIVNLKSAVATPVGTAPTLPTGLSNIGFDFNPTVDRIRVVAGNLNYRMNPLTGGLAATDSTLRYVAGDVRAGIAPNAVAAAYTNSYLGTGSTTMYVYDYADNSVTSSSNPNAGLLSTLGSMTNNSGITPASATGIDLDIAYNATSGTNAAYLLATVGSGSGIYNVNLATGSASAIGAIGASNVTEMAVYFAPIPVSKFVYALAGNNLISFNSATPGTVRTIGAVSPVVTGHSLVGLDFRPATGQLYAMSYESISGQEQLYTIDTATGAATKVGGIQTLAINMTRIGFDFNPMPDRIRVTASGTQNYRLNPETGAIAATDSTLRYASGDARAGQPPGVATVAYSNNVAGTSSTTMFAYDAAVNSFASSSSPNLGILNTVNSTINITPSNADSVDMDISTNNTNGANFALLAASGSLYVINPVTGIAGSLGTIGSSTAVSDIAIYIAPPPPVRTVYAVSGTSLVSFRSDIPGTVTTIGNISVIATGQALVGLDFRPSNNSLYGFGYNATTGQGQLYLISTSSAQAMGVGNAITLPTGLTNFGFDFNPTVDLIRLTAGSGLNYRLNPTTGAATVDGNLAYAATGDVNSGVAPTVAAVGYTNSFAANMGGSTTLFYYDYGMDVLATTTAPNAGTMNTIGNSGIMTAANPDRTDMDVVYNNGVNTAFLSATLTGTNSTLYSINTRTGEARLMGTIGLPIFKMAFSNFDPLPITLVDFSGRKMGSSSELTWATQSESNNSYFLVERSSDGISFTAVSGKIVTQAPNGNSTQRLSYSFTDAAPAKGLNYYRLVQVDKDGKTITSKAVQLRFNGGYNISLYPNPAISFLNVNGNLTDRADLQIRLSDLTGKTVSTTALKGQQGNWSTQLSVGRLAAGTYYITIVKDNTVIHTEAVQKK